MRRHERPAAPRMARPPLWYKDTIIYQLHVKAFYDSDDDGIGDFRGLVQKLDYIKDLGVTAIWLLPFYVSPLKDDGYDIADYHAVHPDYGTINDFRLFVREAHRRGLHVITELVLNHTSDQHPWFQAARHAPSGSIKRDYYVWSDTDRRWPETRIIFTDTESSNWAWDPVAKAYYWHRFFSHQPDLNFDNPHVTRAVHRVMRFWFDLGVDGMRLDAIPYLRERDGTTNENLPETHAVLKQLRAEMDRTHPDRFFLAEVNQWPEDVREYFGNGDECQMAYHFPLMPRIFMAVAEEDRLPILDILQQTPEIPESCQWAIFLRNHDELTLEMVTARERDYMYSAYAADKRMRINVGIRRRLAPLMENNRRKIELVNSLLMSLIGSPILYYGDELGMGDNIYLGDRNGVRTPMQWGPDRNAGFSRADPQRLFLPPVMDPIYGYQAVNVEAQSRSPSSLLNWMKRLIAVRRAHVAFGRGSLRFIRPGNRKILAYVREYAHDDRNEVLLCVANLARSSQPVELDLSAWRGRVPVEMIGGTTFPPIGELPYLLTLPGWGFYWFELSQVAASPDWHDDRPVPAELPVMVIPEGILAFLTERDDAAKDLRVLMARHMRARLEREVLPVFLATQRWYAAKDRRLESSALVAHDEWGPGPGGQKWMLAMARVLLDGGEEQTYALPLSLAWEDTVESLQPLAHCTVARVRQRDRMGVLYDAYWDDGFCLALVDAMRRNLDTPALDGRLRFWSTSAFDEVAGDGPLTVRHPSFEQSNTLLVLGDRLVLKAYRRLRRGINPEIEIGHFLTEESPFDRTPPLLGALEYVTPAGETIALAVLQRFADNQGSAWQYTLDYLHRSLEASLAREDAMRAVPEPGLYPAVAAADAGGHEGYLTLVATLGERTAGMHRALARRTGNVAFEPEPVAPQERAAWVQRVEDDVDLTLGMLKDRLASLGPLAEAKARALLELREPLLERIGALLPTDAAAADASAAADAHDAEGVPDLMKTRLHGDYHLGQLLVDHRDFLVVDFEGEPSRPPEERRAKHSPLRDVAGMVRSFGYAAAVAAAEVTALRPDDRARLMPHADAWRTQACEAFLSAYFEHIGDAEGCPRDRALARQLIELFTIEKALYEVRYELGSRPKWVHVPLRGLLAMFGPAAMPGQR